MREQINSVRVEWPDNVRQRFAELMEDDLPRVTQANYFTPRPWRNEWDRGDDSHGFVYTLDGRHVCIITLTGRVLVPSFD